MSETMVVNSVKDGGAMCFGCGACMNACPQNAIMMEYDAEGFLCPAIDGARCVQCGLCVKSCPALGNAFSSHERNTPTCFAAYFNDAAALQSSSGGVFAALAENVLSKRGFVCGVAFDDDWLTKHVIVSTDNDLGKLRTSKYVQSDTNYSYRKIRNLLDGGDVVLFSGTPCQVAGLYGFLGGDRENLLTVDVFCHGAPSPKVWEKYLREDERHKDAEWINFRDKSNTEWKNYHLTIKGASRRLSEHHRENIFMRGFLQNLYLRKCCSKCIFATTQRVSDISLGDFWNYKGANLRRNAGKGISALLVNTAKGGRYFSAIRVTLRFAREVALENVIRGNPVLKEPSRAHKNRDAFFADFTRLGEKEPVSAVIAKHLGDNNVGILSFASLTTHNYGAVLVGYAMERAIAKLGYSASTIGFIPRDMVFAATADTAFSRFRRQYMNLSGICVDKAGLQESINGQFGKIVIGSDQTIGKHAHHDFVYYLDWACGKKTLLAYAASFGVARLGMGGLDKKYAAACLRRFDAFSMREEAGAHVMKMEFGMDCPVVCDPAMLLSAGEYGRIIDEAPRLDLPAEYVAHYFLGEKAGLLDELSRKYPIVDAYRDDSGECREVGDWLRILKNAKYVVTDSFHGGVFSILFRRQFVVAPRESGGNDRLHNLLRSFGIDNFHAGLEPVTEETLAKPIDYDDVQESLKKMRAGGCAWLQSALETTPGGKKKLYGGTYVKLLNALPAIRIFRKSNGNIHVRLFGIIPLLKIKGDALYLFEALKIARRGSSR